MNETGLSQGKEKRKEDKIKDWKVRALLKQKKWKSRKKEMKIKNMQAVEFCEIRWERNSESHDEEYGMYYSRHERGGIGVVCHLENA